MQLQKESLGISGMLHKYPGNKIFLFSSLKCNGFERNGIFLSIFGFFCQLITNITSKEPFLKETKQTEEEKRAAKDCSKQFM